MLNKMGSQGKLVQSFASLLRSMWQGDLPYITPIDFRVGAWDIPIALLFLSLVFRKW